MTKPRIKANQMQKLIQIQNLVKRDPFYTAGIGAGHLIGTKHSKAWGDFGYPLGLDFYFYHAMYERVGLGAAVVLRPVEACWLTPPTISVGENDEERSADEKKLDDLLERLDAFNQFRELDEMQRVGHYAGAIVRVADGKELKEPLDKVKADEIVQIMPAWEGQLIPGTIESDTKSMRYGLPRFYTYNQRGVTEQGQRDGGETAEVHHSRVIIWNEGARGNTIYGQSSLKPVFNALIDWEKVRGAGGEGFWRQASLRGVIEGAPETAGTMPDEEELDDILKSITDMQESFDALPFLGGAKLNTLQNTMSDPKGYGEIILQDVAAGCGWSAKGLVGSQTGRLAGDQDSEADMKTAQARRENYLSKQLKGFMAWLVEHGAMPKAKWKVNWDDLLAPSDDDKLKNASTMSDVNQKNAATGGVYTPEEIRLASGHKATPETEMPEPEFKDGPDDEDDEGGE